MAPAALLVAGLLLVSACSPPKAEMKPTAVPAAPVSKESTEALSGGGVRATSLENGLRLSVVVPATMVTRAEGIGVLLELQNVGSDPVTWDDFMMGWGATIFGVPNVQAMSYGLGPGGPQLTSRPFTLASGESTTAVRWLRAADLSPGVYRLHGGFQGPGGPQGTTPEIVVTVKPR